MEYKLEIPYFLEGLEGARNLFTKIILIDLYNLQKNKGEHSYIILISSIMCDKFEVDRKTYFNSLKKLEELSYIKRDEKAYSGLINGTLRKKQTRLIVDVVKLEEQFKLNDFKMNGIKEKIKEQYFNRKNNLENLELEDEKKETVLPTVSPKVKEVKIEELEESFPFGF